MLIGAAIGLVGGFTATFLATVGQFIRPITAEFGWGRTELSIVVVMAAVGSAVGSPLIGRLVQRFGSRPFLMLSGVFLAAAFVAFAAAPAETGYFALLSFLVGLLAVGTTSAALLAVVPRFFDRRLGLALGAVMGGSAVGTAILQIAVGSALVHLGWRSTYLLLAGVVVVLIGVAALIGFPPGTGPQYEVTAVTSGGLVVREALRWPRFSLLLGAVLLSAVGTAGSAAHFVPFVIDQGIEPQVAAGASAAAGFGVAAGRFVSGALLDRVNAPRFAGGVFLIAATALAVSATLPPSPVVVYASCALASGFALGAEGDIIPFLLRRYVGVRAYAPVLGIGIGVFTLGGAIGTAMFGLVFDGFGSYVPALLTASSGLIVAAILLQFMGPYRYPGLRRRTELLTGAAES
ncbi:MFS transporter [Amycolatopsis oliviviridis]|uniref:MFS transporter n=1 Tax=Amycolatopsis oliviviridis TaxID=1471590 RepID=UPI00174C9F39|nr:MFS transporter [Amycolatopsis oliviviridis]